MTIIPIPMDGGYSGPVPTPLAIASVVLLGVLALAMLVFAISMIRDAIRWGDLVTGVMSILILAVVGFLVTCTALLWVDTARAVHDHKSEIGCVAKSETEGT